MHSKNSYIQRLGAVALTFLVFTAGYVCGVYAPMSSTNAEAQLGDLGTQALKGAAGSAAGLGSVGQMGTALVEMEQHVTGLQKNLDALKKVKASLGG